MTVCTGLLSQVLQSGGGQQDIVAELREALGLPARQLGDVSLQLSTLVEASIGDGKTCKQLAEGEKG